MECLLVRPSPIDPPFLHFLSEIPRACRQPALLHLRGYFPDHIVSQVCWLHLGEPVKEALFDYRTFHPKTNPLFVELKSRRDTTLMESAVVAEVDKGPRSDKGKRRATES
jgi:hypothetical protein